MQNETSLDPTDWERVRALGHRMVNDMLEHVRDVRSRPAWEPMSEEARQALDLPTPTEPGEIDGIYEDFINHVLPYGLGNTHPRFWGWVIGSGTYSAALADFLAAAMNTNAAGFNTSIVVLEEQVLSWLREMLRLPDGMSGILLGGASQANFVGIAAGLRSMLGADYRRDGLLGMTKRPIVYASQSTHFSVKRAVRVLGLGDASFRIIGCDVDHAIDVGALREAIHQDRLNGHLPCIVVGNAGTVGIGGFDNLEDLADLCAKEQVWLHADGAFGAMVALSDRYAHLVKGMERVDSMAFDLHKWLHTPIEAAGVFIRDPLTHHATFAVEGAYLGNMREGPAMGVNRFTDLSLQQSRGARAVKIWFSLREHGQRRLAQCVEMNIEQASWLAARVQSTDGLELIAPVACNIVCFRCAPEGMRPDSLNELNKEVLTRIQARGIATPSSFVTGDIFAIRCSITNHRTTYADLEYFLDAVQLVMNEILEGDQVYANV